MVDGEAALHLLAGIVLYHLIGDADVGERAAHHHFVIAAPRAVGVEVRLRHAVFGEVGARGRGLLDRTSGADVIGCD
jgi:hypothetical protein